MATNGKQHTAEKERIKRHDFIIASLEIFVKMFGHPPLYYFADDETFSEIMGDDIDFDFYVWVRENVRRDAITQGVFDKFAIMAQSMSEISE